MLNFRVGLQRRTVKPHRSDNKSLDRQRIGLSENSILYSKEPDARIRQTSSVSRLQILTDDKKLELRECARKRAYSHDLMVVNNLTLRFESTVRLFKSSLYGRLVSRDGRACAGIGPHTLLATALHVGTADIMDGWVAQPMPIITKATPKCFL